MPEFWLINLAEANFHYPPEGWLYTSIVITGPSDWTMNENVTIAFTVTMSGSGSGKIVGTVTSIQCLLDNSLIIEDANTHVFLNNGNPQNLNYFKIVGPLTFGEHTLTIKVTAYKIYSGKETKNDASSSKSKTFLVGSKPTPTPTPTKTPTPTPQTFGATLSISGNTYQNGDNVNFTVTVAGGVEPFTYTWFLDNQTLTTTAPSYSSYTFGPKSTTHRVYVQVTGADGWSTVTYTKRVVFTAPNPNYSTWSSPSLLETANPLPTPTASPTQQPTLEPTSTSASTPNTEQSASTAPSPTQETTLPTITAVPSAENNQTQDYTLPVLLATVAVVSVAAALAVCINKRRRLL